MINGIKKMETKFAMVKKNWNIKDLATNVPMDYIYLTRILKGDCIPSEIMAIKISNALEVNVDEVFYIDKVKEPQ
ncbi:helix-turn-helix transcriptional regulator [Mammaliicoccus sp. M-M49]|uniref:helix-turn-helix domain-containing protein n=1 Tax=Mammaliicoccus sp. M-M49 TaxID=2898708 RepID=UPI001EFB5D35|nr:helix-turn-helix transcriptional regulator [Mammaliicoccus sp. M-M49]